MSRSRNPTMSDEEDTLNEEISKFEHAQDAGTENGHLCTLILADGNIGAAIAVAGLSVLGRTRYGMFQLSNFTHEATHKNIKDIPEIATFNDLVGLKYNTNYSIESERKKLRYGKVMLLTDQNEEGSHFKGLIINYIYTNWPHLIRQPFLEQFITPAVKVSKDETKYLFFSSAEFEEWKAKTPDNSTYDVSYYVGLGSNNRKEAKEYFSNMDRHRIVFKYDGPEDDKNIIKVFGKDQKDRRQWMMLHMLECKGGKVRGSQNKYLYTDKTRVVTYSDFINLEYIHFAHFDEVSSIPNFVDGLKPGQRKVLFTCIKRNEDRAIKVHHLAGSTAETALYDSDESSLCKIICKMAQDFVGTNNINLLIPLDQFGTRLMGGDDIAEHYHITTTMSKLLRLIFHPHDDPLLSYNSKRDQKIEPEWYVPIIPMLLVNGGEGTGTCWSTKIPKHCPLQIIECLRYMMAKKEPEVLKPYYRKFRGKVQTLGDISFMTIGCVSIIEGDKIEITELPIGTWTVAYRKSVLDRLLNASDTENPIITGYKEFNTDKSVRFVVSFAKGEFERLKNEKNGFHRLFQLCRIVHLNNMHAINANHAMRRYENTKAILKEYYDLRLKFYEKRKEYMERKLAAEADKLINQTKFILAKTSGELVVENKTRKAIIDELIELGYVADPVEKWKQEIGTETNEAEEEDESEEFQNMSSEERINAKKFDYLLGMSMWMMTDELKDDLISKRNSKVSELSALKEKSKYDLWCEDLEVLERKLKEIENEGINTSQTDCKDLFPSEDGEEVVFDITNDFR